jgi:hypothetical protein
VWFACLSNDVEDVRHERRYGHAKPWFEVVGDELVPHAPEPSLLERLRDASYVAEFVCAPLDGQTLAHRVAAPWQDREGLELFGRIAARMRAVAEEGGAKFLCVAIPSQDPAADARTRAELGARGLAPLDLAPTLDRSAAADSFLPDGHWNAAGHARAAQLVAPELKRLRDAR